MSVITATAAFSFRVRLERFLESTPLEVFLVVLVIVDVVILLVMLLLDLNVLHCKYYVGRSSLATITTNVH